MQAQAEWNRLKFVVQKADGRELPSIKDRKDASGSEPAASVKRTQAKAQDLLKERFGYSAPKSTPVGYDSRHYLGFRAVSVESKRSS